MNCERALELMGFYSRKNAPPEPKKNESVLRIELGSVVYQVSGSQGLIQLVGLIGATAFAKGCLWDPMVGNRPHEIKPGELPGGWEGTVELLKKICPWSKQKDLANVEAQVVEPE